VEAFLSYNCSKINKYLKNVKQFFRHFFFYAPADELLQKNEDKNYETGTH